MATARGKAALLGWLVVPIAIVPLILAIWPMDGRWFIVVALAICLAAPAAGFWWGEMRGASGPGKAGIGCLTTVALFLGYLLWALLGARWIFGG
ncbi:MAG TPA: hypothetical protein VF593_08815 [Chthoniobacteraceae bacterium]|jgi:hypothetical protein